MRIAHILLSLDPDYGGPAQSVPSLAAAQACLGHDVSLVTHSHGGLSSTMANLLTNMPGLDRVNVITLPQRTRVERLTAKASREHLKRHLSSIDFIHIHDMWQPMLFFAARLALESRTPYAISPRSSLSPWCIQHKALRKRLALNLGWRSMLNRSSFLHALTDRELDELRLLKLAAPIHIIPNGVFAASFSRLPHAGEFRTVTPRLGNSPYILFLGRLHKKKGLDLLISAFKLLKMERQDLKLVIAGPDDGEREPVRAHAASVGLVDDVILTGPLYGAEKFAAMIDAHVFCLPSRSEGFSMAVIEALACGLPAVVSTDCNFTELGNEGAGTVVALSASSVADGLAVFLDNESKRREASTKARAFALTNYSWEHIATTMAAHYADAISNLDT